jgi:unsaturated rhamnogalacturonyl hydrolase
MTNPKADLHAHLESMAAKYPDRWTISACGVTGIRQSIPALLDKNANSPGSNTASVLIISGLSGSQDDVSLARRALESFRSDGAGSNNHIGLSAIPDCNPDGLRDLSTGYPPTGDFFYSAEEPEKRYLWRWICFQAPSLILELIAGESVSWQSNDAGSNLASALAGSADLVENGALLAAMGTGSPDGLGPIPGLRLTSPPESIDDELGKLWKLLADQPALREASPARQVLEARSARSYLEVAHILASVYGYQLDPVNYTQGVGISGRLQLYELSKTGDSPASGIVDLVEPYVSGSVPMFGERVGGANLAGLIWGRELSAATGDPRYADLIVDVANRYQPGIDGGAPPPCDRDFRTEDMFMAGAMLGRAFEITGETRYLDLLVGFITGGNIQQESGLFWHCRPAHFYWGRGNGFAAMGLTETLTYLPENYPGRDTVASMYRKLLDGLIKIQDTSGMLPQVLDIPGSYQELTATCMLGYSLARGLRRGWLGPSYQAPLDRAWRGVSQRVDDEGNVVDGCASTGVQATLNEYLDRPAVFGFDDRTGGMALWFTLEMLRHQG